MADQMEPSTFTTPALESTSNVTTKEPTDASLYIGIVGLIIGVTILILVFITLLFTIWKFKRRRLRHQSNDGELERQDYSSSGEEYLVNALPESQRTPLSQNTLRLSRLITGFSSFHSQQGCQEERLENSEEISEEVHQSAYYKAEKTAEVPFLDYQTAPLAIEYNYNAAEQIQDVCVHHDEGQAVEAIRSSSTVPVKLSPVEAEGSRPGIPQQALTRPNIETRAPFNVYFEDGADNWQGPRISRQEVHQTTYFSTAEKTARVPFLDHLMLECDCNGREYTNVDHDITLRIPKGAVAEGEKVHLEVAVTMYGPFNFPEGTKLISPILWLCLLEEAAKLRKPLEIVLPHYLIGDIHKHGIGFLKANHSDYEMNDSCQIFYNFRPLVTDKILVCREGQGYGITVTDHFCYFCLVAQDRESNIKENTNYCLTRVISHSSESLQEIIFCASYHLPTCIKAIQDQYPSSTIQYSRPFKFKDPQGSLKIIVEQSNDQYLIAMDPSNAEINASNIDFISLSPHEAKLMHDLSTYPPRVKMSVDKISTSDKFVIPVKIDGCAEDGQLNVDLLITREGLLPLSSLANSGSSLNSTNSSVSQQASGHINLTLPWTTQSHLIRYRINMKDVFRATLNVAAEWYNIGILLSIPDGTLSRIKHDEGGSGANSCLRVMLIEWLKRIDPPPTWSELADAVELFDESKADEIRTRYLANNEVG